jgi:hypothetical protein
VLFWLHLSDEMQLTHQVAGPSSLLDDAIDLLPTLVFPPDLAINSVHVVYFVLATIEPQGSLIRIAFITQRIHEQGASVSVQGRVETVGKVQVTRQRRERDQQRVRERHIIAVARQRPISIRRRLRRSQVRLERAADRDVSRDPDAFDWRSHVIALADQLNVLKETVGFHPLLLAVARDLPEVETVETAAEGFAPGVGESKLSARRDAPELPVKLHGRLAADVDREVEVSRHGGGKLAFQRLLAHVGRPGGDPPRVPASGRLEALGPLTNASRDVVAAIEILAEHLADAPHLQVDHVRQRGRADAADHDVDHDAKLLEGDRRSHCI